MPERQRRPLAVFLLPVQPGDEAVWRPAVDIYRASHGWLLKFDVAGVRPEDVWIRVADCHVTVRGVRRDLVLEEGYFHYAMEISYSRFERVVQIPCNIQEGYQAEFRDGYLLIRLFVPDDPADAGQSSREVK